MKIGLLALLLSTSAFATPYFRLVDPSHPQPVVGALFSLDGIKQTEGTSLLPLITHTPKDGCLLPSIVCEDWSPLSVGAAFHAGKITLDVAPLANVLPWIDVVIQSALPDNYLSPIHWVQAQNGQAITFSAGPVFEYQQLTNKGYFRLFTGLALHF